MVGLGDLPGGAFDSRTLAVCADGSVAVGYGDSDAPPWATGETAFIWDSAHGMRDLRQALIEAGVPGLADWHLTMATDVSDDGYTIVGWGYNPSAEQEAWMATIPEPASALLLAIALCWARGRR
jgi:uncharacterized membrane protein